MFCGRRERDSRWEKRVAVIRKAAWDAGVVRKDVVPLYGAAWVGLGREIIYNGTVLSFHGLWNTNLIYACPADGVIPADPMHRAFAVAFYKYLSSFPLAFPINSNPVRVMPGGLGSIVTDGFALIGSGKVADREKHEARKEEHMRKISAEKLIYRIVA